MRWVRLCLESRAVAVAAELLADRCRVSTSSVLLAGTAALLGAATGHDTVTMQLIASNRSDARRRGLVSVVALNALLAVDLGGVTFHEAVRRAQRAAMVGYHYAAYDPFALEHQQADLELERGASVDLTAFFNDTRTSDRWESLADPGTTEAELRAFTADTTVSFVSSWPKQDSTCFFQITHQPRACQIFMLADTTVFPRDRVAALLRGIETLLVRAAFTDAPVAEVSALTGVHPVSRDSDWVRCPAGWVSLSATRQLLREVAGTDRLGLFAEPRGDGDGHELVAYLEAAPGQDATEKLHAAVVTALAGRTDVLAPDRYHLCHRAPADPADPARWRETPAFAVASGRLDQKWGHR
jgi:hypothetical protein